MPDGAGDEVGEVGADIDLLERPIGDVALHELDHIALEGRQVVDDAGLLDAELEEDAGDEPVVLPRDADEDIEDVLALRRRKASNEAEVDQDDVARRLDEDVAGVKVAVEVAVLEDHLEEAAQHALGDGCDRKPVGLFGDGYFGAMDALECQQPLAGEVVVDAGRADALEALKVRGELGDAPALGAEIELTPDGSVELTHDAHRVHEFEFGDGGSGATGKEVEDVEVALNLGLDAGPLHLDDDLFARATEQSAVDLRDARAGERQLLEHREDLLHRPAKLRLDDGTDIGKGHRRDIVLKLLELLDDVVGDQIAAGGEDLAELHEGGAELLEHHADALSPRQVGGRLRTTLDRRRDGLHFGQVETLHRGTEPMSSQHA